MLANTENNRQQIPVFLTTGLVYDCHLVNPASFGSNSTTLGRRIAIYPFHIEHQCAVAFIGNTLKRESYLGPITNGYVAYSTRNLKEGTGSGAACVLHFSPFVPFALGLIFH